MLNTYNIYAVKVGNALTRDVRLQQRPAIYANNWVDAVEELDEFRLALINKGGVKGYSRYVNDDDALASFVIDEIVYYIFNSDF